jgi:hypothetical protein
MKESKFRALPRSRRNQLPTDGRPSKPADSDKKCVVAEYLYLDLNVCDRCVGTDSVLEDVLLELSPALNLAGYTVKLKKIKVCSEEMARKHRFASSPTIRINGRDILGSVQENRCGCCSELSGADVDCRVFAYEGAAYDIPPKQMLADAILRAIFSAFCGEEPQDYKLPENLKAFFQGMKSKSRCSCGSDCC